MLITTLVYDKEHTRMVCINSDAIASATPWSHHIYSGGVDDYNFGDLDTNDIRSIRAMEQALGIRREESCLANPKMWALQIQLISKASFPLRLSFGKRDHLEGTIGISDSCRKALGLGDSFRPDRYTKRQIGLMKKKLAVALADYRKM
jgi:hypothetical protein